MHLYHQVGSFQEYVVNDGWMFDFSPSIVPVDELHKLGLLDVRLLNLDRNEGNILVRFSRHKAKVQVC